MVAVAEQPAGFNPAVVVYIPAKYTVNNKKELLTFD
jgi:hypothetical protein